MDDDFNFDDIWEDNPPSSRFRPRQDSSGEGTQRPHGTPHSSDGDGNSGVPPKAERSSALDDSDSRGHETPPRQRTDPYHGQPKPSDHHQRQPPTGGQTFSDIPSPQTETSGEIPRPKPRPKSDTNREDKGDSDHDDGEDLINGLRWVGTTLFDLSATVLGWPFRFLLNRLIGKLILALVVMLLLYCLMPSVFSVVFSAIWSAASSLFSFVSDWIGLKQSHAYTQFPKLQFQQVISTAESDNLPIFLMACRNEVQTMNSETAYELAEDFETSERNAKAYRELNDKFIQEIETHSNAQFWTLHALANDMEIFIKEIENPPKKSWWKLWESGQDPWKMYHDFRDRLLDVVKECRKQREKEKHLIHTTMDKVGHGSFIPTYKEDQAGICRAETFLSNKRDWSWDHHDIYATVGVICTAETRTMMRWLDVLNLIRYFDNFLEMQEESLNKMPTKRDKNGNPKLHIGRLMHMATQIIESFKQLSHMGHKSE